MATRPLSSLDQPRTIACAFWDNVLKAFNSPSKQSISRESLLDCSSDTANRCWLGWQDIGALVERLLIWLSERDLPTGARVASCLPNSVQWLVLDLACQSLGLVHVAIDARETSSRVQELFELSQADILFSPAHWQLPELAWYSRSESAQDLIDAFGQARSRAQQIDPCSPAQILFTSGTFGQPKAVVLSHRNLTTNCLAKLDAAPQFTSDLRCNVLPFAHAYARTCELSAWILTGSRMLLAGTWEAAKSLAPIMHPSLINIVPYLADQLADLLEMDPGSFGSELRLVQVGGAGLASATWHRLSAFGLPPLQGYGMTETSPVIASNRAGAQIPNSVGPPVTGVQVRIDQDGVLWTRGPHVMLGYWNRSTLEQPWDGDQWFCTGDLAEEMDLGYLRIVGRVSSRIVLSTGYKLSPEPIESRIARHPMVHQAVLVGENLSHVRLLVVPEWQAIPQQYFQNRGLGAKNLKRAELRLQEWSSDLLRWIQQELSDLPNYSIPASLQVIEAPFTQDDGTLTRKGSFARVSIENKYRSSESDRKNISD